jgi:signal transduction histidine kinase
MSERNEPQRTSQDRDLRKENRTLSRELVHAHERFETSETARQAAEAETAAVRATETELREIAAFRERLIGVIGHDLRNPLNAILMAASLLVGADHLNDTEAQLATRIIDSGRRMKRMISQLAEFTRARLGGEFPLELAVVDLGLVCEQVAAELRLGAGANVDVVAEGDTRGRWDGDRLAEVISNIAGNAVEHAAPGTAILIEARGAGPDVTVAVTNRGETIPPELLPVVFDPFRRAPSRARSGDHLGLGLYIAYEIARAHGGTLGATSAEGVTTFTMRLPRGA